MLSLRELPRATDSICVVLEDGSQIEPHSHHDGQLLYAARGVFLMTTVQGTWVAPADRVTWTPPGFEHYSRLYGAGDVRTVAVPLPLCSQLPSQPTVYRVGTLVREGLLALSHRSDRPPGARERLRRVLIDELTGAPQDDVYLPEPEDDRLRAVTRRLYEDPADNQNLTQLGRAVGASDRTLSRLFRAEMGMSFYRWRTLLRVQHSLVHLEQGRSVTTTALLCGWSNPSSFIESFTEVLGQTPGSYRRRPDAS